MPDLSIRFKPEPNFDDNPMDFITSKYSSLHKTLVDLLTADYKSYLSGIYIVAPKPTTFKVVLHNNQHFFLTYLGPSYSCKILGKKYYLNNYSEQIAATNAIARILELGNPLGYEAGSAESPEGPSEETGDGSEGGGGEDIEGIVGGEEEEAPEELAESSVTSGGEAHQGGKKIRITRTMKKENEEPTGKELKSINKSVSGDYKIRKQLSQLVAKKDQILNQFKSGKINLDQYKKMIGDIPSQIKALSSKLANMASIDDEELDEGMDINDPVMMDLRAAKDARERLKKNPIKPPAPAKGMSANKQNKLNQLLKLRQQIEWDMEQEAEPEGGPIADQYGAKLDKIDKAINMLRGHSEWGPEKNANMSKGEIEKRASMINESMIIRIKK